MPKTINVLRFSCTFFPFLTKQQYGGIVKRKYRVTPPAMGTCKTGIWTDITNENFEFFLIAHNGN